MTEGREVERPDAPSIITDTSGGMTARYTAEELWDSAEVAVISHELINSDNQPQLVGIPFIVTGVTYRESGFKVKGAPQNQPNPDYVSVEAILAPEEIFNKMARRRKIDLETYPYEPGERIVFNDRSTGIYRQITAYLNTLGIIKIVKPDETLVTTGPSGSTSFDRSRWQWYEGAGVATDGIFLGPAAMLKCWHGLRASDYENEFTPDGRTYYLA